MMDYLPLVGAAAHWIIMVAALFIVPKNRKPTSAMAWLLVIWFLPLLGILIYLVIGSPKLPKSRRDAQAMLDMTISKTLHSLRSSADPDHLLDVKPPPKYQTAAQLSRSLSHLPVSGGNRVELLPEYEAVLDRIVSDIDGAKHYVHLEYFIVALDDFTRPLFDAMARAVKRGVTVRVLYDAVSSKRFAKLDQTLDRLRSDGVLAVAMLPLRLPGHGYVRPDLRNHRKLVVVDGTTGYTGSQNMIQRNYHRHDAVYYDELVVRLQGPAVLQLAAVFITDWHAETGEIINYRRTGYLPAIKRRGSSDIQMLPSGPGYEDENNLKLFVNLLYAAQRDITIVNPYFVPDDALMTAITSAARRGVRISMVNSQVMDQWMVGHAQRSFYDPLLQAGVRIYLYDPPILLHTKFMVIDSEIATIGSSNMDIRSFQLDLEVTMICYDPAVAKALNRQAAIYQKHSMLLDITEWHERPRLQVMMDNIARLTSAVQ